MRFGVLGPLIVVDETGRELPVGGAKPRAVLAILLLQAGRVVASGSLVDELWPSEPPQSATKSLQVHVSRLRRALAEGGESEGRVQTRAGGYALRVDTGELDSERFERMIREGDELLDAGHPQRAIEAFEAALALWRGRPLCDFAYESFAQGEIARLTELHCAALEQRVACRLQLGHAAYAVGELERLVRVHPFRERLRGQLMLALYRTGRQADALEAYRHARETLVEELGIEPSGELRHLHGAILVQDAALLAPATAVPTVGLPLPAALRGAPESGYVGRADLRARLSGLWGQVVGDGERHVALLTGEPGVGKTRLAMLLAHQAHASGATVLYGRCDEDVPITYRPWRQVMTHWVEHAPPDILERHVREHGSELSRLAPPLASRLGSLPPPRPSDPETERHLLFVAAAAMLQAAARWRPVVLVFDDLQWADDSSLALLRFTVGEARGFPLLVVGTFRDSGAGTEAPLAAFLARLAREPGVERFDLAGLTSEEVAGMFAVGTRCTIDQVDAALAEEVAVETGGNAFFVTELLRHLIESGAVVRPPAGRGMPVERLARAGLPRNLHTIVAERVARLGDAAAQSLSAAAVIGREFDLDLLAQVTGQDEDDLLALAAASVHAALIVESPTSPGRFAFRHALIKRVLRDQLGPTRRARLHRRVGEVLEELCGQRPEARATELAHHWNAAGKTGDRRKAVQYARLAGEHALAELAPKEALQFFEQALELLDQLPDSSEAERCELLIDCGDATRRAGWPGSRETLLDAAAIAQRLGDSDLLARAALLNSRGWVSSAGSVDSERIAAQEAAIAALPRHDPRRAMLLAVLATELAYADDFPRCKALCEEALEIAVESGDERTLAEVMRRAWQGLNVPRALAQRKILSEDLVELAERLGDPRERLYAFTWRFMTTIQLGELESVETSLAKLTVLAAELGQPLFRWVALTMGHVREQLRGDIEQAEALAEQAVRVGAESGEPDAQTIFAMQLMEVRWEQGRMSEIVALLEERVQESPGLSSLVAALAFAYAETGQLERAGELLERGAVNRFRRIPHDIGYLQALGRHAETVGRLRATGHAEALYRLMLPYRDHVISTGVTVCGSVERSLGLLAATAGRHGVADGHYAAAVTVHERLGATLLLARTWMNWGQALSERGPAGEQQGREMLRQAVTLARGRGAAVEREARLLLERSAPSPQVNAIAEPLGRTPRRAGGPRGSPASMASDS